MRSGLAGVLHRQLYYIFVNVQARVYGRAILSNCYIIMYGAYAYAYGYIRRTMRLASARRARVPA